MDQISVNTPTKIPARNIIKAPLYNSISTETLANNISIDTLVNNTNPYPYKDINHLQYHTWKKIVLDVDLTTKVLENC